jgi:hypothetical protein
MNEEQSIICVRTIHWRMGIYDITLEITDDGLHAVAEASEDQGASWRKDLEMAYVRIA